MTNNIRKTKINTYWLEEICPKCSKGTIIRNPNSQWLMTNPPQIGVCCTNENCDYNNIVFESNVYPKLEYERISLEFDNNDLPEHINIDNYNSEQLSFIEKFINKSFLLKFTMNEKIKFYLREIETILNEYPQETNGYTNQTNKKLVVGYLMEIKRIVVEEME